MGLRILLLAFVMYATSGWACPNAPYVKGWNLTLDPTISTAYKPKDTNVNGKAGQGNLESTTPVAPATKK